MTISDPFVGFPPQLWFPIPTVAFHPHGFCHQRWLPISVMVSYPSGSPPPCWFPIPVMVSPLSHFPLNLFPPNNPLPHPRRSLRCPPARRCLLPAARWRRAGGGASPAGRRDPAAEAELARGGPGAAPSWGGGPPPRGWRAAAVLARPPAGACAVAASLSRDQRNCRVCAEGSAERGRSCKGFTLPRCARVGFSVSREASGGEKVGSCG